MKRYCENIYKTARKNAGLTQENAAELLNVSPRTLLEYEAGRIVPPDDIVCKMVEVYKEKSLAYLHLKNASEVGRRYLPELHIMDLPTSVLLLQKEVTDVTRIHPEMIDVACGGRIDENENAIWSHIENELYEMIGAGLSVIFAKGLFQKKKTA